MRKILGVIPARLASTRLPRKVLLIAGTPSHGPAQHEHVCAGLQRQVEWVISTISSSLADLSLVVRQCSIIP